jgi:hypothetical protein
MATTQVSQGGLCHPLAPTLRFGRPQLMKFPTTNGSQREALRSSGICTCRLFAAAAAGRPRSGADGCSIHRFFRCNRGRRVLLLTPSAMIRSQRPIASTGPAPTGTGHLMAPPGPITGSSARITRSLQRSIPARQSSLDPFRSGTPTTLRTLCDGYGFRPIKISTVPAARVLRSFLPTRAGVSEDFRAAIRSRMCG